MEKEAVTFSHDDKAEKTAKVPQLVEVESEVVSRPLSCEQHASWLSDFSPLQAEGVSYEGLNWLN